MSVSPTSASSLLASLSATSASQRYSGTRPTASTTRAANADTVSLSPAAQAHAAAGASTATQVVDTNQGALALDLTAYFSPPGPEGVNLDTLPLLAPTPTTINALTRYVSDVMPAFLAAHGIAAAPASITYDNMGQMQLPADYADAEAFKQALAEAPALERAMRSTAALASGMVEMNKSLPFQQAYLAASTQAQADAVVAKYAALFSNHQHVDLLALNFSAQGALSLTRDGQPLSLT